MADFMAETIIDARDEKGAGLQFRFAIEAPKQIDEESWGCGLLMQGITDRAHHRIVGIDAWQALTLALRMVEQMLTYFVEDGGSLFWEGSDAPLKVSEVVPRYSTRELKSEGAA